MGCLFQLLRGKDLKSWCIENLIEVSLNRIKEMEASYKREYFQFKLRHVFRDLKQQNLVRSEIYSYS